jgi:hypothetical protein
MLGIMIAKERYERWWLRKYCRPANQPNKPFKKVVRIEMCGSPSFVYGQITFHYDDGGEDIISGGATENIGYGGFRNQAYKPRKCDVEVKEDL